MTLSMQFDAVSENLPGDKWLKRWNRSWPAYRQWFIQRGGDKGPTRTQCAAALKHHMPELLPTWKKLSLLAGDDDMAAQFLSTWCPPAYLGACSLAAMSDERATRLVRNYDLSPDLNEGLLLRSEWTGTPVMGMVEFLWGLSDGINQHGLAVALAYGGSRQVGTGFGITTILRYVMETCHSVQQALEVFDRIPSHMAYNVILADTSGTSVVVELSPGGGMLVTDQPIATNHQQRSASPDRALFTQTFERFQHLESLLSSGLDPTLLADEFLKSPLFKREYTESLGTLFTADYDPDGRTLNLRWPDAHWPQLLDNFQERSEHRVYTQSGSSAVASTHEATTVLPTSNAAHSWLEQLQSVEQHALNRTEFRHWMKQAKAGNADWATFSNAFTRQRRDPSSG